MGRVSPSQVYPGFSRDGFDFSRPGPGAPWPARGVALSQDRRVPIFTQGAQSDPTGWNWGTVRAISAGGLTIDGDELRFFVTGSSVTTGPLSQTTGVATLRRDGFASYASDIDGPGVLTTKVLRWDSAATALFVNMQRLNGGAGQVTAEILDAAGTVQEPFSKGNALPTSGDSTRAQLRWRNAGNSSLLALRHRELRLRFHLDGARLFSFWASAGACGASDGWVAAGGRGFVGPRDTLGRCV